MAGIFLGAVRTVEDVVYRLSPDYLPPFDFIANTFQILTGPQFVVIADLAIRIAIFLLIGTPRQFQLSPSAYETTNLLSTYDYIVVGGGTTGAMVANRLVSNTNGTVLLIEAGEANNYLNIFPYINSLNINDDHFGMNWHLRTTPQPNSHEYTDANMERTSYEGGGKGLGGTSMINWQIYSRGFDTDYDLYESKYGATGWNYESMLAAMKRSAYQNGYDGFEPDASLHSLEKDPNAEQISVSIASQDEIEGIVDSFLEAGAQVTNSKVLEDHNSNQEGFARMQFAVQENGYVGHAGRRFIYPIRNNENDPRNERLHIILRAEAQKIGFSGSRGDIRASSVTVEQDSELRTFMASKEIIVTAGFYGTPTVLLKSGVGPKSELEVMGVDEVLAVEGVGKNLHNHQASMPFPVTFTQGKNFSDLSIKQVVGAFVEGKGRWRSDNSVTAIGFDTVRSDVVESSEDRPNIEYILYYQSAASDSARRVLLNGNGLREEIWEDYYLNTYGGTRFFPNPSVFASATLLHPETRGTVTIRSGETRINYAYLSYPSELEAIALANVKLVRILYTAYAKDGGLLPNKALVGCQEEFDAWVGDADPNDIYQKYQDCISQTGANVDSCLENSVTNEELAYQKCYIQKMTSTTWHMGGTARIGDCSDELAVVDNRCRVCGIPNLRVSDASVLPEPLSGHNIATLYGIAQKCSESIIEDNA
ncbi:uncharacterized protein LOC100907277 [Galendromus occidentalis]|uniref:Uncharacterized protein LOC100907277 n=1 Tax=Galendromus occidentalis TaxID=34638 RepID=A0AAJ6QSP7_9ACAR|nr:uncharacterized protein LOC100907277 [Galendromus occidentalis]